MMGSVNQRHKITDAEWIVRYIESWRDLEAVYMVWDSFIQTLLIDTKQRMLLPLPFFNASSLLLFFFFFAFPSNAISTHMLYIYSDVLITDTPKDRAKSSQVSCVELH